MAGGLFETARIDFSPIAGLFNDYQQGYQQGAQRRALADLATNGDYNAAARRLMASGNLEGGISLANLARAEQERQDALQLTQQFTRDVSGAPSTAAAPSGGPMQLGPAATPGARMGTPGGTGTGSIPPNLVSSESGGNFRAQNNAVGAGGQAGHFGRLQFGQARLQDAANAGIIPRGTTPQQFLNDPAMQQRVEQWHFGDIDNFIRTNGLDRAIGQQIGGVPVTMDGMRAVAHLGGTNGLLRFIQTGGQYNPADANGTRLSDYFARSASTVPPTAPVASQPLPPASQPQPTRVASITPTTATDAAPAPAAPAGSTPAPTAAPASTPTPPPTQVAQAPAAGTPTPPDTPAPPLIPQQLRGLVNDPMRLAMYAAHPRASEGLRQVARTMLQSWMESNRPTDAQREYLLSVAQGDRRSFNEFDMARRTASATQVSQNIDQRASTAEETARANARSARFATMANDADSAQQDMYVAERLAQAMSSIEPGARTAAFDMLRQRFGVVLDPNADNVQAVNALINYLGPRMRVPGSGSTSDYEGRQFMAALPSLMGTPGGNELAAQTVGALVRHRLDRANIAVDYQNGDIDAAEATRRIRALPNPFETFGRWQQQNARREGGGETPRQVAPPRGREPAQAPAAAPAQTAPQRPQEGVTSTGTRFRFLGD